MGSNQESPLRNRLLLEVGKSSDIWVSRIAIDSGSVSGGVGWVSVANRGVAVAWDVAAVVVLGRGHGDDGKEDELQEGTKIRLEGSGDEIRAYLRSNG